MKYGDSETNMQEVKTTIRTLRWFPQELHVWKPPERLPIAEWAEKYRILTEPSEEKGPLRLRRTPYLIPIMNACLDPNIETIVLCKSAQIAGTECMLSILGFYAHQEPCPIMYIMADEDTAKYISRFRIQKMFSSSPELSQLIIESRFSLDEMTFMNGAYICTAWASSVARLASRPVRVLILDEIDKPGYYVKTKEGDPISLAIQRTETFYNRKILMLSTPTIESGNIWSELMSCDVIFDWHVPCPYCGQYQPLRFNIDNTSGFIDGMYRDKDGNLKPLGMVKWEGGSSATDEQIENAGYECGSCHQLWTTVEKNKAVEQGIMVPRTELKNHITKIGFHINRLYSLLGKSGEIPKIVRDYLSAKDDPRKLQAFVNSTLAEPWIQKIIVSTESDILKARCDLDPGIVPESAVALTCGVDIQKYGFWYVIRAWARDYTSWLIDYGFLPSWEELEFLLFETQFPRQDTDEPMRIWRAAIDTGGGIGVDGISMTNEAYTFIRENRRRGVFLYGTKGSSSPMAVRVKLGNSLDKSPSGRMIPGGLRLVLINTNEMKDIVHFRLRRAIEQGREAAYLHKLTDAEYAKQITAEQKRLTQRGIEKWVQISKDNHLLDAEVLAHATADSQWPGGGVNLIRRPIGIKKKQDTQDKTTTQKPQSRQWLRVPNQWLRPIM